MRRFGIAAALGLLLLAGGAGSLAASDTPKAPQSAQRRKAIGPRHQGKADATLENLYVDSEIGQVFSVDLGRADQPQPEGSAAGPGVVHVYQLSGGEEGSPARVEVAGLAGDDEEGTVAESETAPADEEDMETAGEDAAAAPAEEPVAAPEAAPQAAPAAARKTPANPKDDPKTPPPAAASSDAHSPTLPPIR